MSIRSMFSGVSGLQAHSTWLDVIGNNISNVNTVAYKASRVEFASQISQQMSYASGSDASAGLGGINGEQIGLGTRVESIQTLFTQGTAESTGLSSDLMISGSGFLISNVGGTDYYTRAGNLTTDSNGYLVDSNGGMIQGWSSVAQYTQRTIDNAIAGDPLQVTDASLQLDTATSPSNIQITTGETCPAHATQTMTFAGNLDAALKATDTANGGMLDLGSVTAQTQANYALGVITPNAAKLPFSECLVAGDINANKVAIFGGGPGASVSLQQINDLTIADPAPASQTVPSSVVEKAAESVVTAQANRYIWDDPQQMSTNPPATTFTQTVYDSNGLAREITVMAWQVNDLGDGGVNAAAGPNQAAYAWYAFDTTDGAKPASANLLGGTGLTETYNRNTIGDYTGDLLYFNTDGSLASQGDVVNGSTVQAAAHLYLPALPVEDGPVPAPATTASPIPTVGAEIMDVTLNFGTSGLLSQGKRDGVYSDAAGSYATVNGVSTYVPQQSMSCTKQDGYTEGTLESWSFDTTGKIQGVFSNSQTIVLGQLAMARVANEDGLVNAGNNYFTTSANSGDVYVGTAGTNGIGTTVGGELEGSNVDLTTELTNMIIAQRGFESNSKVITTADQEWQTINNLKQ
jgi:flagellar hook protein FlgE